MNVAYHGTLPFYFWGTTYLYIDRKDAPTDVKENLAPTVNIEKTFITLSGVSFKFNAKTNVPMDIVLYSIDGRVVKNIYRGNIHNDFALSFDISHLQNGIYFIKDRTGMIKSVKILKQ